MQRGEISPESLKGASGCELTPEELENVSGGFVAIAVLGALALIGGGLALYSVKEIRNNVREEQEQMVWNEFREDR